jgi:hypothetical protein
MMNTTPYALLAAARAALSAASTSKPPEITPLDTSPKKSPPRRVRLSALPRRRPNDEPVSAPVFGMPGSGARSRHPAHAKRLPAGSDSLASHRRSAPHQEHDNNDNQDHDKKSPTDVHGLLPPFGSGFAAVFCEMIFPPGCHAVTVSALPHKGMTVRVNPSGAGAPQGAVESPCSARRDGWTVSTAATASSRHRGRRKRVNAC